MTETGAQLLARLEGRRSLNKMDAQLFPAEEVPPRGEVVELQGTEGTGKTELLYHLISRCLLPHEAGGLESEVLFLDADYNFDLLRLVTILEHRLATAPKISTTKGQSPQPSSSSSPPSSSSPAATAGGQPEEALLRSCLSRLLVVHCSSSSQLLLILHYLENTFCSRPSLSLLLIDSISAFYWVDRCGGGESVAKQEEKLRKSSELLDRLIRDYKITVLATTQAIMRPYGSSSSDSGRLYLCHSWQRLVTHRLLCSKANMASTTNKRQLFTAHCTSLCSSSSSVKTKAHSICSFYVTESGVTFI